LLAATVHGEPTADPLDLGSIEQRIETLRKKEHSLERTLLRDGTELEQARQRIVARGRAYYRMSRARPSGDFFEHAVRLERLRRGLITDLSRARQLSREQKGADRQLTLLRERRLPLESEVQATGRAREALMSQRERESAFAQAFLGSSKNPNHTAVYSAGASLDTAETFAAMRGQLSFPLPGRAEIEEVKKPFALGPGLVLRAAPGTVVRSVFAGRVAYASEYAEYGRTVIVDHGEGYFTVTAGLSSIDVRVGEDLPAGVRLGVIGNKGPLAELYFEIRRGTDTLAPREWFGI
jgi:septal ring factor EnvC (AmiA/AmiB activator)